MLGYVATHGTNPAMRKVPYDAVKDFTPIAMIGATPNVLVMAPRCPVKNVKEFIEYAKKNAGQLRLGRARLAHAPGDGTVQAGRRVRVVHVPYRGIAPALTDLIGGHTQVMLPGLAAALGHISAAR